MSPVQAEPAASQSEASIRFASQIDALFEQYSVDQGTPGAAVSVYHQGRQIFASGYGYADLEAQTRLTAQTPIHVASVSKQFTAFAIALLAQEGKVDLDADVRTYLPWMPTFSEGTVTVRHLILHTSGLRDQWSLFVLGGQDMGNRLRQQQVVNMVKRQRALNFKPGSQYSYSNTGYTLLAEIIKAVSGQTLREFTTERIFAPLGMRDTFFFDDVTELVPGRAHSYSTKKGQPAWQRHLLNYDNAGATSLFTTAEDMTKWAANFTHPVVGDAALISQITAPGRLADGAEVEYAFGLMPGQREGYATIEHSGSDASFRALFVLFPEHYFAVTVLANTGMDLDDKVDAIARLYLPAQPAKAPVVLADAVEDAARLQELSGWYLTRYDSSLQLDVEDGKLGYTVERGTDKRRLTLVLREDQSLDDGQRGWQYYQIVRNPEGQIIALDAYDPQGRFRSRYKKKSPPVALTAQELAAYVGDYRSEELDITYSVSMGEHGLEIGSIWSQAPATLRQVSKHRFEASDWALGTLVFQLNPDNGAINGFLAHSGRIRHLAFDRVQTK